MSAKEPTRSRLVAGPRRVAAYEARIGVLARRLTEMEAGLIGAYGRTGPVGAAHLGAEARDGRIRLTLTTGAGDTHQIVITPDEARAYAAVLIHTAHDA